MTCAVGMPGDTMISRPSPRSSGRHVSHAGPRADRVMASRSSRMIRWSSSLRSVSAKATTSVRTIVQFCPISC